MRKANRNFTAIIVVILLAGFLLEGCGLSKAPIWTVKKQGRRNAVEYIKNKYGEEPKVRNTKVEWGTGLTFPGCLPSLKHIGPTGDVTCEMRLDDDIFKVIIEGDTKECTGYDDREKDLICDQILTDIENRLSVNILDSRVEYQDMSTYNCNYYLHNKFSDLESFYNECHTTVFVATTDKLDRQKFTEYYNNYELTKDHAYLLLFVVQYKDKYSLDPMSAVKMKDVMVDPDVVDYFIIRKSYLNDANEFKSKSEDKEYDNSGGIDDSGDEVTYSDVSDSYVTDSDMTDPEVKLNRDYYNPPEGCELSQVNEYFEAYAGEEYFYRFYFYPDEELLALSDKKSADYMGNEITVIGEADTSHGRTFIAERADREYDYYVYHVFSADRVVNFEFNSDGSNQIDIDECKRIVKSVLK